MESQHPGLPRIRISSWDTKSEDGETQWSIVIVACGMSFESKPYTDQTVAIADAHRVRKKLNLKTEGEQLSGPYFD